MNQIRFWSGLLLDNLLGVHKANNIILGHWNSKLLSLARRMNGLSTCEIAKFCGKRYAKIKNKNKNSFKKTSID